MKKRAISYLILCVLILHATSVFAKPRTIYLDKELKEASLIEYVEILGYADSTLTVQPVGGKNKITVKANGVSASFGIVEVLTSYWPAKGEKVLVVIGANGFVSLFATKQGEQYRFWSPFNTGSLAIFYFKKPALKLPDQKGLSYDTGEYETCWDGCLLAVDLVMTYGR